MEYDSQFNQLKRTCGQSKMTHEITSL